MDILTKRLLSNTLIYENNWFIGSLWKNQFVRTLVNCRVRVVTTEDEVDRELNNPREEYSNIFISWKDEHKIAQRKILVKDLNRGNPLKVFSKIINHARYRGISICFYSEEENIDPIARKYLREYSNLYMVHSRTPPFGVLERLDQIIIRKDEKYQTCEALFHAAALLFQEQKYEETLAMLASLVDDPKLIVRKLILKLNCYFAMGRMPDALDLLEKMESYQILSPSILILGVKIYERLGNHEKANRFIKMLSRNFPDISETKQLHIEVLREKGDVDEIKKILLSDVDENSILKEKSYSEYVRLCLERQQYENLIEIAARKDFRLLRSDCCSITDHARDLHKNQKTIQAIRIFNSMQKFYHEDDRWQLYFNLGEMHFDLGNYGESVDSLAMSLIANPQPIETIKAMMVALPMARKERRIFNQFNLKSAIRKRVSYLNRVLDARLKETEDNAFKFYTKKMLKDHVELPAELEKDAV